MASRDKKSAVNLYPAKKCRRCGGMFHPAYANQQMHEACFSLWRRDYQKKYQRSQRKIMRAENFS